MGAASMSKENLHSAEKEGSMAQGSRLHVTRVQGIALARRAAPALITGGAGDAPAGVVTYTTVGATMGLSLLENDKVARAQHGGTAPQVSAARFSMPFST
jgi:hypothetical protein